MIGKFVDDAMHYGIVRFCWSDLENFRSKNKYDVSVQRSVVFEWQFIFVVD